MAQRLVEVEHVKPVQQGRSLPVQYLFTVKHMPQLLVQVPELASQIYPGQQLLGQPKQLWPFARHWGGGSEPDLQPKLVMCPPQGQ